MRNTRSSTLFVPSNSSVVVMGTLDDLPDPLVPSFVDVRNLDGFLLNVERLMASELVALSTHEVIAAALFLWCRAWKQIPAASLPDDEKVLAAFARLPLVRFRRLTYEVMRGFVKCNDGRLYHKVLAEEAIIAFEKKKSFENKRNGDAERLRKWRESKRQKRDETHNETLSETLSETRFVAEGQDKTVNPRIPPPLDETVSTPDQPPSAGKPAARPRKSPKRSIPEAFTVSDRVKRWAQGKGFDNLDRHLESFIGKAKAKGYTYADWDEALMGAIRDDWAGLRKGNGNGNGQTHGQIDWGTQPDGSYLDADGNRWRSAEAYLRDQVGIGYEPQLLTRLMERERNRRSAKCTPAE